MTTYETAYARYLSGYSEDEIEKELHLPKGKAQFCILICKLQLHIEGLSDAVEESSNQDSSLDRS